MRQIKNVAALADIIASNGEIDHSIELINPIIIVAIIPAPDVFFQKKVNRMTAENVLPTPVHAKLTIL
jgi:hypothetical protein